MDNYSSVIFFLGTKAQFIKTAPLLDRINNANIPIEILDTGQHKSTTSTQIKSLKFQYSYKSLSKNKEDISTILGIISWFIRVLLKILFTKKRNTKSICILHGDTASTLLGIIWAKKNNALPLHMESGSRSGTIYRPFPEEVIRIIVERYSKILICEREFQLINLDKYRDKKSIVYTQYPTIFDAISKNVKENNDERSKRLLVTIHRTENILNKKKLNDLVNLLIEITEKEIFNQILWLCHEPTFKILQKNNQIDKLAKNGVELKSLVSHSEFLIELNNSKCILTDGGGVIQEAEYLSVPLIIWRKKNEVDTQYEGNKNILISNYDKKSITNFISNLSNSKRKVSNISISPSQIVCDEIEKYFLS